MKLLTTLFLLLVVVSGAFAQLAAALDPTHLQDGASLLTDLWKVAEAHPASMGAVTAWVGGEHALPYVTKIKANGMVQLIFNIVRTLIGSVRK